jgi:hypothetical protein
VAGRIRAQIRGVGKRAKEPREFRGPSGSFGVRQHDAEQRLAWSDGRTTVDCLKTIELDEIDNPTAPPEPLREFGWLRLESGPGR